MKTATLIAIIAVAIDALASLYYLLQFYRVIEYSSGISEVIQPLFFLSNVGLLVFFILLYQKQSKN